MSAGWLVYALIVGTLLTLSAAALESVARAHRWPTRWIWAASMIGSLAVIGRSVWPRADVVTARIVEGASLSAPSAASGAGSVLLRMANELRVAAESAIATGVWAVARWLPAWTGTVAAMLWLVGAAAGLGVLGLVQLRLRRARRRWPTAELHGRRVRVAPTIGPAVVGIVRPEIVVPQWLFERAAEEQRLVLAHEGEHVRARDHLLLGGACVVVALLPWHPAAWWSLARLRLAVELDCDARVLRRGAHVRSYGEMLIDLAGQCSGFRVGATALADKTSHLERRLLAMKPTAQRFTHLRIAVLCAAAALSLAAACEARVPTSAEIQSMDVASAERVAGKAGLMAALHGGATPEFYVNDVKVSAAEAHAIRANDIATVDVQKSASGKAPTIRIRTVAVSADGSKYRTGSPAGAVAPTEGEKGLHERVSLSHDFGGILLVNGVRVDAATLHTLDPNTIAGIEVIKGRAATELWSDPAAKNGIIKVTLK